MKKGYCKKWSYGEYGLSHYSIMALEIFRGDAFATLQNVTLVCVADQVAYCFKELT